MPAPRVNRKRPAVPSSPASEVSSRRSVSLRRPTNSRTSVSDLGFNDDEEERRSRRRSNGVNTFAERSKRRSSLRKQVGEDEDATDPAAEAGDVTRQGDGRKRKSATGSALDSSTGGKDSRNTSVRAKKARLSVVGRPQGQNSMIVPVLGANDKSAIPQVSMEVMSSNFEEWMKMATDNKINTNNTWGFALIDYFADLTLLRNGPDDASINFQKASCTLDGCVKVWTSRVDSVATETGKLINGLALDAEDDDGEGAVRGDGDEDDDDADDIQKKTKKRTQGNQTTLAKSFDALKVKKLDLEFTVDPLFKKTSADFDEGGAMGLLMNHLSIDGKGRVVFDSGDVEVDEEDEQLGEDGNSQAEALEDLRDLPLIEKLQGMLVWTRFLKISSPQYPLEGLLPSLNDITRKNVSVTLADFKFSADPNEAFTLAGLTGIGKDDDDISVGDAEPQYGAGNEEDFFGGGNDFVEHDQEQGFFGNGGEGDMGGEDFEEHQGGHQNSANADSRVVYGPAIPFDPSKSTGPNGLVMAMDDGDTMMLDYFDQGFLKNWAGPEHWKVRRAVKRADPSESATTAKQTRKEKTPFLINFEDPEAPSAKDLFATSKTVITLPAISTKRGRAGTPPKGKKGKKAKEAGDVTDIRDEHLLPDDMHFSSRQLLRLFMKPKFTLKMRRRIEMSEITQGDGEIDESFWASAAAARAGEMDDDVEGTQPNGYDTQFFHDDVDDAGDFAEVDDGLLGDTPGGPDEDDPFAGTQDVKRVKPEAVNYAKRAKRVDVKRLKDNIWKGLKIPAGTRNDTGTEAEMEAETLNDEDYTPGEERTFSTVIENLRGSYTSDKMSEISTSFCFICLLHLANEQGLEIEPARFDDGTNAVGVLGEAEGVEATGGRVLGAAINTSNDRIIGELQALRVRKVRFGVALTCACQSHSCSSVVAINQDLALVDGE
ncbi:hypothetical protein QFC19_008045 [Naganishia cerealis]|uniref:Uncharacterized protein n=1 Tax=Naganishia cerealis TaxID=610337 RepID=A0ACC2V494_9TREE|nr:hypothetical protein QFC19_008045 [Naganishia cerealis]